MVGGRRGLQFSSKRKRWSIDKRINGYGRVREYLQASTQEEAEKEFDQIINRIKALVKRERAGVLTFRDAVLRYIDEVEKRSMDRDLVTFDLVDPYIGHLLVDRIDNSSLKQYFNDRRADGIKSRTLERDLAVIKTVLRYVEKKWRNLDGEPFIKHPVELDFSWEDDSSIPYPLGGKELKRLLGFLPLYLRVMAIFAVNTGVRDQNICKLKWSWEKKIPELNTSIFVIPDEGGGLDDGSGELNTTKNKLNHLVVLNKNAREIVEMQRNLHDEYVFPYKEGRLKRMHTTSWKTAWKKAGLPTDRACVRGPHNLKHTFGFRIREAGLPFDVRKKLLHHKAGGDVSIHYSPAQVAELIEAVEKVAGDDHPEIIRVNVN